MYKKFIKFLFFILLAHNLWSASMITIENQSFMLDQNTTCSDLIKNYNYQNSCDCCILKKLLISQENKSSSLNYCQQKYYCDFDLNLEKPKKLINQAFKNLKPLEIIDINLLNPDLIIPADSLLDKKTIKNIFYELIKSNKIILPDWLLNNYNKSPCFKFEPLGVKSKGFNSGQLFSVFYNQNCRTKKLIHKKNNWKILYIIKELKKEFSEIKNLYILQNSTIGQEKISTLEYLEQINIKTRKQALISFDDVSFKINDGSKIRYFSVLQTAPGQSLHTHIKNYMQNTDKKYYWPILKNSFYKTGFASSKLHQKYSKKNNNSWLGVGYYHGDYHFHNIFYDPISKNITLIDNETFVLSFEKKKPGANDIIDLFLLHSMKTIAHYFSPQIKTYWEYELDFKLWHKLWVELIFGYILAFDLESASSYQEVCWELEALFIDGLSNRHIFTNIKNFVDQRELKRLSLPYPKKYLQKSVVTKIFVDVHQKLWQKFNAVDHKLQ